MPRQLGRRNSWLNQALRKLLLELVANRSIQPLPFVERLFENSSSKFIERNLYVLLSFPSIGDCIQFKVLQPIQHRFKSLRRNAVERWLIPVENRHRKPFASATVPIGLRFSSEILAAVSDRM